MSQALCQGPRAQWGKDTAQLHREHSLAEPFLIVLYHLLTHLMNTCGSPGAQRALHIFLNLRDGAWGCGMLGTEMNKMMSPDITQEPQKDEKLAQFCD